MIINKDTPKHGQIIVAMIKGEFMCKTLYKLEGVINQV
jgi:SOS-response transcriptional repressor LexA